MYFNAPDPVQFRIAQDPTSSVLIATTPYAGQTQGMFRNAAASPVLELWKQPHFQRGLPSAVKTTGDLIKMMAHEGKLSQAPQAAQNTLTALLPLQQAGFLTSYQVASAMNSAEASAYAEMIKRMKLTAQSTAPGVAQSIEGTFKRYFAKLKAMSKRLRLLGEEASIYAKIGEGKGLALVQEKITSLQMDMTALIAEIARMSASRPQVERELVLAYQDLALAAADLESKAAESKEKTKEELEALAQSGMDIEEVAVNETAALLEAARRQIDPMKRPTKRLVTPTNIALVAAVSLAAYLLLFRR
jgi:hypothetical protein